MNEKELIIDPNILLPCPFCGGDSESIHKYPSGWFIECPCGIDMGPREAIDQLIYQWNRRA